MTADSNAAFATWIRAARKEAGLSQQRLADVLKAEGFSVFTQTTIAKIEKGSRRVWLDEAMAMLGLFGTTLDAALDAEPGDVASLTSRQLAARTSLLTQIRAVIDAELGGAL